MFVSIVLLGMIPFTALDETSPLSDAFKLHNNNTLATLVAFGAITTTAATTLTCDRAAKNILQNVQRWVILSIIWSNSSKI